MRTFCLVGGLSITFEESFLFSRSTFFGNGCMEDYLLQGQYIDIKEVDVLKILILQYWPVFNKKTLWTAVL